MAASLNPGNLSANTGNTTENVITAKPAILLGIYPSAAANTGTCIVRDSATASASAPKHTAPIGSPFGGIDFTYGVLFGNGITVQNSVAGDVFSIAWMPYQ